MREVWLTLKKYAVFSGRARRREYWMFSLAFSLVLGVLLAADLALNLTDLFGGVSPLSGVFVMATLLPLLAVTVRRLHDTGRSAWWLLLGPLLLVFTAQDSQPGSNQWGNNPKAVTSFAHLLT